MPNAKQEYKYYSVFEKQGIIWYSNITGLNYSQLFEKDSRRNLKSYFGAFNMQWSFGSKSEPLIKIFAIIAFFKENA